MPDPSEFTEMQLSNHTSSTQHPATQSTVENTPREAVDLSLEDRMQDAQVVRTPQSTFEYTVLDPVHANAEPTSQPPATGTQSTIEYTPREPVHAEPNSQPTATGTQSTIEYTPRELVHANAESLSQPLATGTQSTIENTPPELSQFNPEQPTLGVYAPVSQLTDEREPTPSLSGSAVPDAHAQATQSTAELAPVYPHSANHARELEGSETQSATQESNAPQDLVTDRQEDELELPTLNPETGFGVGITSGRTDILDSEEVSDWTPVKTSQVARSEDPQSTPLRSNVDVPGMMAEDADENAPFSSNETFVMINHSDAYSQTASQISSGGRNVAAGEEATTESTFPQMVIRSSQGGINGLEGSVDRAMTVLRGSDGAFEDMGMAFQRTTYGQSSSHAVLNSKEEVPDSDDDEESFESSVDSHRNDILPGLPNLPARRTAVGYGAQSTTSGFLQAEEVDVVMTEGSDGISQPDQGGQGRPTASIRAQQQWPTNRREADHTAGTGANFIDDDETASRHSDSLRTLDTQLPGSQQVPKSAIESEDMPDTQPFRSGVQLPSVGGTDAHYSPDILEAPQMTKRYVTAGRTEIKDSQSSSFTNSESQHSVEDSSQRVPDTDPMRPSIPLAPVTRVSKRPAPDEESKAGESSIKPSAGTLSAKEDSGIDQPIAPLNEEVLSDAPPSSNSIQEPSIVADIPPSPSPPTASGAQSSPFRSSLLKPIDPSSSRGKKETPNAYQNKDILMAELKAMKISSVQARVAALEAELSSKRTKLEAVAKELVAPAAGTVQKHIKLLHDYNDIRDVGQGLVGMIADNRGVRIGELYDEFGVGLKD